MKKIIAILLIIICLSVTFSSTFALSEKNTDNCVLFSIPVKSGSGFIAYSQDSIDSQRFGPESFAILNNTQFYILDNIDKEIEVFEKEGTHTKTISLPSDDEYFDIELKNNGIIVILSYRGYVYELDEYGKLIKYTEILSSNKNEAYMNFLSLYKDKSGDIMIRDSKEGSEKNIDTGEIYTSFDGTEVVQKGNNLILSHKGRNIPVKYNYQSAGTYPISSNSDDELLIVETEVLRTSKIYVEKRISKYDKDKKTGMALAEPTFNYEVMPHKYLYATKKGDAYQMVCNMDNITIYKLGFTEKDKTNLDKDFVKVHVQNKACQTEPLLAYNGTSPSIPQLYLAEAPISERYDAFDRGLDMVEYTWTYDPSSMKTPDAGSTKPPQHLRGSSTIEVEGIPYKWGGFDNISEFETNLEDGKTAGDINSSSVVSSVTGIDCSGFISRAYDISYKLSTHIMHTQFSPCPYADYGDIFNSSNHVLMIHSSVYSGYDGSFLGVNSIESTTAGYVDGVKWWFASTDYLQAFTAMRKD